MRNLLFFEQPQGGVAPEGLDSAAVIPEISAAGWQVHVAPTRETAEALLGKLPFGAGLARLDGGPIERLREDMAALSSGDETLPWIALLSPNAREDPEIRRLVWESFHDFHTLPPDPERLVTTLGHAQGMAMMARDAAGPMSDEGGEPQMVGVCAAMQGVFRDIRKLAAVEAPVLITGESGTGKELAAKAIHERSQRAQGPFVAVNCAALPESLIQSELFGHEKGSFTGAHKRKIGSIEAASGGTLFLDEIGDLTPQLQVNLLRFLEEGTIQRVGNPQVIPVDVRILAATHVDLESAISQARFREDLYFRLHVLRLEMPPLRARGEDIAVLAQYCFETFRHETSRKVKGFSRTGLECMADHDWPGNVRELINRVRRATVMCDGRLIKPADLGLVVRPRMSRVQPLEEALAQAEKEAVVLALEQARSISQAALLLGTSRPRLYRLLAKHGLGTQAG